jgi:hypothetical protein
MTVSAEIGFVLLFLDWVRFEYSSWVVFPDLIRDPGGIRDTEFETLVHILIGWIPAKAGKTAFRIRLDAASKSAGIGYIKMGSFCHF